MQVHAAEADGVATRWAVNFFERVLEPGCMFMLPPAALAATPSVAAQGSGALAPSQGVGPSVAMVFRAIDMHPAKKHTSTTSISEASRYPS